MSEFTDFHMNKMKQGARGPEVQSPHSSKAKSKAIQGKKDKRPNYGMGSRCVQCNKKHGRTDSGNVCKNCSEKLPF